MLRLSSPRGLRTRSGRWTVNDALACNDTPTVTLGIAFAVAEPFDLALGHGPDLCSERNHGSRHCLFGDHGDEHSRGIRR